MRLYSTHDHAVTQVDDPELGVVTPDENGGFELSHNFASTLHAFPGWEDDAERAARLAREEADRRRDPATLLDAVQELVEAQKSAPADKPKAPRKPRAAKAPKTDGEKAPAKKAAAQKSAAADKS
jgi:hypothetical protein